MDHSIRPQPSSTAERLYGRLLMLYPRAYRDSYGTQVLQLVRDRLRDDAAGNAGTGARFWLPLFFDLMRTAFLERLDATMTHSNASRLRGPLGVLGGLFWAVAWTATAAGVENVTFIGLLCLACLTGCLVSIATDSSLPGEGTRVASALFGALGVVLVLGALMTGLWWLAVGGIFSVVVATILIGFSMLLSGWGTPVVGGGLLASALAVFVSNSENWQIWLAVPMGLAWVVAGIVLSSRQTNQLTLAP
ncbi:MAG TPA: hypothetical protein VMM78_06530 [Thermomicrobiales bacterium]|nr:hypothetical protein [Thermomicrobiales bacterium]